MKKILVTGANGLLGQAIQGAFSGKFTLLATARQQQPHVAFPGVNYQPLDVSIWGKCRDIVLDFQPDVIINTAAYTHVDKCEIEREECWRANVKIVENLARAARRNMAQLIHMSTDYIFDGENGPYDEDDPPSPLGYYGKSKLASENTVRMTGIPYVIVRTNVIYGLGRQVKNNFFLWVYHNLKEGKPINVVTDQYNNPALADDLALGIRQIVDQSQYGIFHMGGEDFLSRYDFACEIARVFGFSELLIHPITSDALYQAAPRPMRGGLRIAKAQRVFGYHPRPLKKAFRYLKKILDSDIQGE